MLRNQFEQQIHCPPERFWALFFDDAFNVEMYEQGLGFPSCKISERTETETSLHRVMAMIPKIDMPKAVAKIVGDKVGTEEVGTWDKPAGVYRWHLNLAAFGDKVKVGGTMRVVPDGEGRCKRIVEFEVDAKVFGVGKLLEKTASDNTVSGWTNSANYINGWLAKHPA